MVVIYVMVTTIRMLIVQGISYMVGNETIRWKESLLMSWGEVRGPVNMILAFIVALDQSSNNIRPCVVKC